MNSVLREDIEKILNSEFPFNSLRNKKIIVTGATGFIGSLLIKTLLFCNKKYNLNLTIIATTRNISNAENIFNEIKDEFLVFYKWDILKDCFCYEQNVDYVIHTAMITKSKEMIKKPVDIIKTAFFGAQQLLDYSIAHHVKKFIYISSMEIYGDMGNYNGNADEMRLGYINLKSARSCYPEGKRICETLVNSYYFQYGLNVNNLRLAQTFGAGTLKGENRIFAQFAKSVIEKKDIILHTDGQSEGNYVYSTDAIMAILIILNTGISGETYNVSNMESHTTIKDMAEMISSEIAKNEIHVKFDIPDNNIYGYAPKTKLYLDSNKLCNLGWKPEVGLMEAYNRYISYLKEEEYGE